MILKTCFCETSVIGMKSILSFGSKYVFSCYNIGYKTHCYLSRSALYYLQYIIEEMELSH